MWFLLVSVAATLFVASAQSRGLSVRGGDVGRRLLSSYNWPLANGGHEAVALTGYRDDVLMFARAVARDLPQNRNVLREAGFFDDLVWPEAVDELVLGQQLPLVCDQQQ